MEFISAKCPHCEGELKIPADRSSIICMYCGKEIDVAGLDTLEEEMVSNEQLLERVKSLLTDELFISPLTMSQFNRHEYPEAFEGYESKLEPVMSVFDAAYEQSADKEGLAKSFGQMLSARVIAMAKAKGITRESDEKLFDYRYMVVSFLVPAVLKTGRKYADTVADSILEYWNSIFPKNKLGKATYENISEGFKHKFCYITTAVCRTLQKPDDCAELTAFRDFRDNWLLNTKNGSAKVNEYYVTAPLVVRAIDQTENSGEIYREIWKNHLSPCYELLKAQDYETCSKRYEEMVHELSNQYM